VYSSDDKTMDSKHMENIFETISSPVKEKHLLSGSSHILTRDARREDVFHLVQGFLQSLEQNNR
jgi:esterase/lipase